MYFLSFQASDVDNGQEFVVHLLTVTMLCEANQFLDTQLVKYPEMNFKLMLGAFMN